MKSIDIGVSADRSLSTVFQPLIAASAQAKAALKKDADAEAAALEAAAKKAAAAAAKAFAQMEAASAKDAAAEIAAADKAAQGKVKADQRAFDAKLKANQKAVAADAKAADQMVEAALKAADKEARAAEKAAAAKAKADKKAADAAIKEIERQIQAQTRADEKKERAQLKEESRLHRIGADYRASEQRREEKEADERGKRAVGVGREAMATFAGVARAGIGVGADVLRGTGVSFDLSSSVQRKVALESEATNISNAAYKEGGERVDPAALQKLAREQAAKYSMDPAAVLGGLGAYQEKTGDLPTAMAGLEGLSRLAKATNTDLSDMISAAGDVGNALGDVGVAFKTPEEKAAAVQRVMRGIAAQGQEGAVEIKSLATQMAKLAAASGFFEGSSEKNLEKMGALVQLARQGGGASSSTAAATSISAFVNTLRTPARRSEFKAAGVEIEGKGGMLKDPFEIIKDSLKATGGDTDKMKKLFASVIGDKPVTALATAYKKAGGGDAGIAEVDRQLNRFSGSMSEKQIQSNVDVASGTTASKAQAFQNQLDLIAASLAERVLPALEKLAPKALEIVDALGRVIGWAAENPKSAIAAALVGSIAKAGIGDILSKGVESLMSKAGAGSLTIAVAAATFMLGKTAIDELAGKKDAAVTASVEDEARRGNLLGKASYEARHGGVTAETRAEMEKMEAELQARIKGAEAPTSTLGAIFSTDKTLKTSATEQADAMKIGDLKADLARLIAVTEANKPPKVVSVDNLPPGASPTAGAGTSNTGAPKVGGR